MSTFLKTLGPVEVWVDGRLVPLPSRQLRTLLAALILSPHRRLPAERLIELIWDQEPAPTAPAQLHVLVSRLRRCLTDGTDCGPRLHHRGGYYELDLAGSTADLDIYLAAVEEGRTALADGRADRADAALGRALEQWRGQPLADVSDSLRRHEEPRLAELHLSATLELLQARLIQGRHSEVVPSLRQLLEQEPTRERVAALLIEALAGAGRLAEATDVYHAARHRLAEEFGLDPGAELTDAYRAVLRLRGDAPAADTPGGPAPGGPAVAEAAAAPVRLPVSPAYFVGRDTHLAQLQTQLDRTDAGAPRRVVIVGLPGVGKTSLAVNWAYGRSDRFPDGRILLDLRGFDPHRQPLTTTEAVAQILAAVGVPTDRVPVDEEAAVGLYRQELHHRSLLLVLDNARSSAQVRPLLPTGDGCFTVITSRDHLEGLIAREGSAVLRLGPLTDDAAARLVAAASGRSLDLDADSATRLVQRCGRLPLALRIAAARLAVNTGLDVDTLARELDRDHGGLATLGLDDSEADVGAAFEVSYRFLSADAARVLRLLGTFPSDDVSVDGVMAALQLARPEAERHLAELASASLIDLTAPGRYTLHDLVRQFAMRLGGDVDEDALRDVAARRLVDYYLDGVDVADRVIRPMRQRPAPTLRFPPQEHLAFADQAQALAWLDAEYRNLVACVHGAREHGWHDAAWQIADGLYSYHLRRNRYAEWLKVDTAALAAAVAGGDALGERRLRTGMSAVLVFSRRYDEALAHLGIALQIATAEGNDGAVASVHTMMSAAYGYADRFEECHHHALAAYDAHLRVGADGGAAASLLNAGIALLQLGRVTDAIVTLERTLEQARVHFAREQELADVLGHLADAYLGAGRVADAEVAATEAVAVARDREHPMAEAQALAVLGRSLRDRDRRTATGHLRRAIDVYRELDQPEAGKIEAELATW